MHVTLQEFSELVKATGLVVGGLWVAWTFHKLRKARAAEIAEQESGTRLLRQQPVLAVELSVTESWDSEQSQGYLCVNVALEDKGDQNLQLSFDKSSLAVGYIDYNNGMRRENLYISYPSYFDPTAEELLALTGRIFRVGQRRNMVFTVPITKVGAYFIQFHAAYWRIAFEGQEESKEDPIVIHAIEQMIYQATGRTTLPAALASSAPDNLQGEAERPGSP